MHKICKNFPKKKLLNSIKFKNIFLKKLYTSKFHPQEIHLQRNVRYTLKIHENSLFSHIFPDMKLFKIFCCLKIIFHNSFSIYLFYYFHDAHLFFVYIVRFLYASILFCCAKGTFLCHDEHHFHIYVCQRSTAAEFWLKELQKLLSSDVAHCYS